MLFVKIAVPLRFALVGDDAWARCWGTFCLPKRGQKVKDQLQKSIWGAEGSGLQRQAL
jgi:hypothetical protein